MTPRDLEQHVRRMYELFNAREFDTLVSHLAEEGEWTNIPFGTRFKGREGFRQFLQGWVTAMPDCKLEVQSVRAGEDFAVSEFIGRGTHTGPLVGPAGTLPATGKKVEVRFCEVMQFRGDKTVAGRLYFDAATLLQQLGVLSSEGASAQRPEQPQARPH